jgi:hypothetical protein
MGSAVGRREARQLDRRGLLGKPAQSLQIPVAAFAAFAASFVPTNNPVTCWPPLECSYRRR